MSLFVAYFRFKPGTNALQGLMAFERRKTFQHPPQARVLGEYWVNAPEGDPQVVVVWEAEDEGPADYYDAQLTVSQAAIWDWPEVAPGVDVAAIDAPPLGTWT